MKVSFHSSIREAGRDDLKSRQLITEYFMRHFWDCQRAIDFDSIACLSNPGQRDTSVENCDKSEAAEESKLITKTPPEKYVLGLSLAKLNISVHFCHGGDRHDTLLGGEGDGS